MSSNNFFHSPELYHILEKTSGYRPFMVVAEDEKGKVVAHLLAIIRRRGSLLPPYLFTQGRIYGEGEYDMEKGREEVFGRMLTLITQKFRRNFCTWAEFSNMGQKMFGYRYFREKGYFPGLIYYFPQLFCLSHISHPLPLHRIFSFSDRQTHRSRYSAMFREEAFRLK